MTCKDIGKYEYIKKKIATNKNSFLGAQMLDLADKNFKTVL